MLTWNPILQHHHALWITYCEYWTFLAAKTIENLENPDFENLMHLQNLEPLSLTKPCICYTRDVAYLICYTE